MPTLTPEEARVLGVLVEKALTTPAQYPLSLNAVTVGCNQKSNRFPMVDYDDEIAQMALDSLRSKHCVREVFPSGGRVIKYKHDAREAFGVETPALVVLAELMLRGPQTAGELRGRASRMHAIDTLEELGDILNGLMSREPALVVELPPAPGSRARRYAQMIAPAAHKLDAAPIERGAASAAPTTAHAQVEPRSAPPTSAADPRIDALEAEVADLRRAIKTLAEQAGVVDPFAGR